MRLTGPGARPGDLGASGTRRAAGIGGKQALTVPSPGRFRVVTFRGCWSESQLEDTPRRARPVRGCRSVVPAGIAITGDSTVLIRPEARALVLAESASVMIDSNLTGQDSESVALPRS